jgi:hypothetical protein
MITGQGHPIQSASGRKHIKYYININNWPKNGSRTSEDWNLTDATWEYLGQKFYFPF